MKPKEGLFLALATVAAIFLVILIVKAAAGLWHAHLGLSILAVTISGFLLNLILTILVLAAVLLGMGLILWAIAALTEKVTEEMERTFSAVKDLRTNHAEEVVGVFLASAAEVTVFTLSKDFDLTMKGLIAIYILTFIAILHMTISANKGIKRVGESLLALISILVAATMAYRFELYTTAGRMKVIDKFKLWVRGLEHRDLFSLLLLASLLAATLVMTIVAARSKEPTHAR